MLGTWGQDPHAQEGSQMRPKVVKQVLPSCSFQKASHSCIRHDPKPLSLDPVQVAFGSIVLVVPVVEL